MINISYVRQPFVSLFFQLISSSSAIPQTSPARTAQNR
ncbi:hypothetical protein BQ1740_0109 [Bacillus subtilis]|nr:hypothetical protein BQ1740_0109 [Bacillus subtilis]